MMEGDDADRGINIKSYGVRGAHCPEWPTSGSGAKEQCEQPCVTNPSHAIFPSLCSPWQPTPHLFTRFGKPNTGRLYGACTDQNSPNTLFLELN